MEYYLALRKDGILPYFKMEWNWKTLNQVENQKDKIPNDLFMNKETRQGNTMISKDKPYDTANRIEAAVRWWCW